MSLGIRVLTDLAISGAMVAMLRSNRTGFKRWGFYIKLVNDAAYLFMDRTDSVLDILISFAIHTGKGSLFIDCS